MFDFSFHARCQRKRNSVCKVCNNAQTKAYQAKNPDKVKAASKVYRAENAEAIKQSKAEYFQANKEKIMAKARAQREADPEAYKQFWRDFHHKHKDRLKPKKAAYRQRPEVRLRGLQRNRDRRYADPKAASQYHRDYYSKNSETIRANGVRYYETVLKHDPTYRMSRTRHIGKGGFMSWTEFRSYGKQAKEITARTGEKHVVDHIYPLISDRVCGLNVPANLRIVPEPVNQSKANKLLKSLSHEHYAVDPWELFDDTQETTRA